MIELLDEPVEAFAESEPRRVHWSVEEFYRVFNQPEFNNRKLFLIDGEVMEMSIPNPPHDTGITMMLRFLNGVCPSDHIVRIQQGMQLAEDTFVQPDFAIVPGTDVRQYSKKHPRWATLIVEVSDTSIYFDKREKFHLYAASNIPEYWIIDVNRRVLIVCQKPIADVSAVRGFRYSVIQEFHADAVATLMGKQIPIDELIVR